MSRASGRLGSRQQECMCISVVYISVCASVSVLALRLPRNRLPPLQALVSGLPALLTIQASRLQPVSSALSFLQIEDPYRLSPQLVSCWALCSSLTPQADLVRDIMHMWRSESCLYNDTLAGSGLYDCMCICLGTFEYLLTNVYIHSETSTHTYTCKSKSQEQTREMKRVRR